jgi:uncharacterized protein (TIGR02284 family)
MMGMIANLTSLAELCYKGEQGFQSAAGVVKDTSIKVELYSYSQACRHFYMQLQFALRHFEATVGSADVRNSTDLSYFNLASTLNDRNNDSEVIAVTKRAVEAFKRNYESSLKLFMTTEVKMTITDQYQQILSWSAYLDGLAIYKWSTILRS